MGCRCRTRAAQPAALRRPLSLTARAWSAPQAIPCLKHLKGSVTNDQGHQTEQEHPHAGRGNAVPTR